MLFEICWSTEVSPSSPVYSGVEEIEVEDGGFDAEVYDCEENYAKAIALKALRREFPDRTIKIQSVEVIG